MLGICECGCGTSTRLAPQTNTSKGWVRGEPLRFVNGHSGSFRGGVSVNARGYRKLLLRDHPMSDCRGYVLEHRLVMSEHLGRTLSTDEVVHHIDGDRLNNSIENLQLFVSQVEHRDHHVRLLRR